VINTIINYRLFFKALHTDRAGDWESEAETCKHLSLLAFIQEVSKLSSRSILKLIDFMSNGGCSQNVDSPLRTAS